MTGSTVLETEVPGSLPFRRLAPFVAVSALWLGLAVLLLKLEYSDSGTLGRGLTVLGVFWLLANLDLLALAKLFYLLGALVTESTEKRGFLIFPASYWGAIKLACTGLFLIIMAQGQGSFPAPSRLGILSGLGTLVIVPLLGGLTAYLLED